MKFVLEYNEQQHLFHNNYLHPLSHKFTQAVNSFGWRPIAVLSDDWFLADETIDALELECMKKEYTFDKAADLILRYLCSLDEKKRI